MSENVFLEPELEDLLSKLVEADKKIPTPIPGKISLESRQKFIFHQASQKRGGGHIKHPNLPGGAIQTSLSNLQKLEHLGFVGSLREVKHLPIPEPIPKKIPKKIPIAWEFDVTGKAHERYEQRTEK